MNKDEILVPILTAINDLREEVRENRRAIQKNSELISKNSEKIDGNSKAIASLEKKVETIEKRVGTIEKRMERHEEESKKDRKTILDILYSYEQVTDKQYKENKRRIEKLEQKFATIST